MPTVLIVEDNPEDALFAIDCLDEVAPGAYEVRQGETVAEAHAFLSDNHCDVILLDLLIPDMSGVHAVGSIRAAAPDTALVVVNGVGSPSMVASVIGCGAQDYLVKERVTPPLLQHSVELAIARQKILAEGHVRALEAARMVSERRVVLSGADLRGETLTALDLEHATLDGAQMQRTSLDGANLQLARLRGATLEEASLRRAHLQWADLTGADLTGADLGGANLRWATFAGASLARANLGKADLRGTDLRNASLDSAYMATAVFDDETKLPDDFDAEGAGMDRVEAETRAA